VSVRRELHSGSAEETPRTNDSSGPVLRREAPRPGHVGNGSYAEGFVGGEPGSGHDRDGRHGVEACTLANPLSFHYGCQLPKGDRGEPEDPRTDSSDRLFGGEGEPNEPGWKDLCRQATIERDPEKVLELVKRIIELLDKKKEQPSRQSHARTALPLPTLSTLEDSGTGGQAVLIDRGA
jgi:hypothetical protein